MYLSLKVKIIINIACSKQLRMIAIIVKGRIEEMNGEVMKKIASRVLLHQNHLLKIL